MTTTQDLPTITDWPELPMPLESARGTQRPRVYVAVGAVEWPAVIDGVEPAPDRTMAERIARRCLRVALYVLTMPFRGVRSLYWAIDTDAKVRSLGEQTVGRVDKTRTDTQVHTDPETGAKSTTYTHYVSYSFPAAGGETRRGEKKVGSLGTLKKNSALRVYFLSSRNRVDSAIDRNPRVLASHR